MKEAIMNKHYLDPDGTATARGNGAETHFEIQLQKRNIKYRPANRHEQRMHWDYFLLGKKIDVKCDKRVCRQDKDTASKKGSICLELHGAQWINSGWLAGEEGEGADCIAFQLWNGDYIFFNRQDLYDWAKEKASKEKVLQDHKATPYQQYFRFSNKLESFMWASLEDMKNDLSYTILRCKK